MKEYHAQYDYIFDYGRKREYPSVWMFVVTPVLLLFVF